MVCCIIIIVIIIFETNFILQELSSSTSQSFSNLPNKMAPHCKFNTVTMNGGKLATVLVENPAGCPLPVPHKLAFEK